MAGITKSQADERRGSAGAALVERKRRLERLLKRRRKDLIAPALAVDGKGRDLMAAVVEHDLEGSQAEDWSLSARRSLVEDQEPRL
jgi:hypothetical protein